MFTIDEAKLVCDVETRFPSSHLREEGEADTLFLGQYGLVGLPAAFRGLVRDTVFLASLLNSKIGGAVPKLHAVEFYKSMLLLGYRIVELRPLYMCHGVSRNHKRVHLGLIAFLLTFLERPDREVAKSEPLSRMLLEEIGKDSSTRQESQEAFLWLLFMGAVSSCLHANPSWISITAHTLDGLGLKTWEDVRNTLAYFPWVNTLHDPAGRAFWIHLQGTQLNESTPV